MQVDLIEGLTWTVHCDDDITVTAAQLQHRLPCWGYVFQEAGRPPLPNPAKLEAAGISEVCTSLAAACPSMYNGPCKDTPVVNGLVLCTQQTLLVCVMCHPSCIALSRYTPHGAINSGQQWVVLMHDCSVERDSTECNGTASHGSILH